MAGLTRLGVGAATAAANPLLRRLGVLSRSRSYGSAAAVHYDYDDYDYYSEVEEEEKRFPPPIPESSAGFTSERGVQWVLIGDPGANKHAYAEKLAKLLDVPHISMGSLLRHELKPRSSLYKQIANAVNEGKLVPEDVIFSLLSKKLEEGYYKGETGFILDGIPRTRIQAEILDQIADIDLVVNFKCNHEHLAKRNFLNMGSTTSSVESVGNTFKEKFRIYAEEGKALEDYYRKQQKLVDFQVAGAPGETWQGLLSALHLKHLNAAASSSKKLTV